MKKNGCKKGMAMLLVLTLLLGVLGGCGQDAGEGGASGGNVQNPGEGSVSDAAGGTAQTKGRYVESRETLPEELAGWTVSQTYVAEGKLRLLAYEQKGETTVLREWEKGEDGFTDVTQGWLSSLELNCGEWFELQMMQAQGGIQYLYAGYIEEEEGAFKGHLWKGQGDAAEEITPQKWTVPNEEFGGYDMITGMAALDNGTLAAVSYSSVDILSGEDGSVIESAPAAYYDGRPMTDGEYLYLCASEGNGGQIEKWKEGKSEAVETLPYPSANSSMMGGEGGESTEINVGGAGSLALAALEDGTVVAGGESGIFRLPGGDIQGQWELLVEGIETDFAMTECYCMGLAALEDGSIYALFQEDGETRLNRYVYDPDAVSEVTQVLKLYTVYENSLLKQAATKYHKAHPEVRIDITYAYPMYSYETPDYNAVYQDLNTRLMGDDAPDIVVMDHLNMDSYAEKGLLEDLENVVRPLEESGELLSNITGAYVREDGKRYAVPLQFGFQMALGRDISAQDMGSIESLAKFLSGTGESYMEPHTVAELVDEFYPYFCDEIVSHKQLDKEALGKYLDYLKVIGDNCGIIASRSENEVAMGMWELGGKTKLAFEEVTGFSNAMMPISMVDYIKGDFTAFEGRFHPSMQTGLCTKSAYLDTARDFLEFALSEEIQYSDYYNGFPVNGKSLEKQAAKDRSNMTAATMISTGDGGYIDFESKAYPKETADKLVAICGTLDKPVKEDAKIREVLIENIGDFLTGAKSKEEVVQKVEDGLKMYLAE